MTLNPVVHVGPNATTVDSRFERLKETCKSLKEWANASIGVGVFFLAIIGVAYTT